MIRWLQNTISIKLRPIYARLFLRIGEALTMTFFSHKKVTESQLNTPILLETIESIQSILSENASILKHPFTTAKNYKELQAQLFLHELSDELQLLDNIFASDNTNISSNFIEQCAKRAEYIHNTCLAFNISPHSPCNQMYWQIANKLFMPKNMSAMLRILQPKIKNQITFEPVARNSERWELTTKKITSDEPPDLQAMSNFIIMNDKLLDVRDLARLDFAVHQKLQLALNWQYPQLAKELYQHNTHWQQLGLNLALVPGDCCLSIDEVLDLVRAMLIRSNCHYNMLYDSDVSFPPNKGRILLAKYFQSLLIDIKNPSSRFSRFNKTCYTEIVEDLIMQMMDPNIGVRDLINTIEYLVQIRNFPLFAHPSLSETRWQTVFKQYSIETPLYAKCETIADIPEHYQKYLFRSVSLTDTASFMFWLLTCPLKEYSVLFRYATINATKLPEFLAFEPRSEILTQKQNKAFVHALVENVIKMGNWKYISEYVCGNHRLLEAIVDLLTHLGSSSNEGRYSDKDYLLFEQILSQIIQNPHVSSILKQLSPYYKERLFDWAQFGNKSPLRLDLIQILKQIAQADIEKKKNIPISSSASEKNGDHSFFSSPELSQVSKYPPISQPTPPVFQSAYIGR